MHEKHFTDRVTLIYTDEQGETHHQPLPDITEVGTLIDPETGDDLELADHVLVTTFPDKPPVSRLHQEIASILSDRGNESAAEQLLDPDREQEISDSFLGPMIDSLEAELF